MLWSDIGYPGGANINEIFAHFYNKTPDGVVNERWGQTSGFLKVLVFVPGIRQAIDWYAKRLWLQRAHEPARGASRLHYARVHDPV